MKADLTAAQNDLRSAETTLEAVRNRLRGIPPPAEPEEFWALKDVSFSVGEREVVGLIGKNGAGKSTLLKILSRITEPTSGEIHLHGKVASLLEVGIGNTRDRRDAAPELPRDLQILDAVIADGPYVDLSRHPKIQDLGNHIGSLKIEGVFRKGCRERLP